ncbi:MAG TPA: ATP-binding cassette domain-containing protein [Candidatus Rifleibacterium sp.]|nr:ATP-binding cassette domain-containing protein [Candidatus Rifleibacterium sp.]HPT46897.1 ATP-binding cassette domain-containing protein [Candidatus Rifleibacterium sp.]
MLQFHNVSFTYPSAPSPLFTNLSLTFGKGWSGLVGPNGSGKTTLISLAAGELKPDSGHVRHTGLLVCCPQRSEKPGDNERGLFDPFNWSSEKERLCRLLEIQPDWLDRWQTLSQGEQKRFQVAAVLAQKPDILLVDEPTNHLDMVSAGMIFAAFRSFEGIGILISHDRRLLDDLCRRIVFIDPPDVLQFSGNYSQALEQKNGDEQGRVQHRENLKRSAARLENELRRRTEEADHTASRISKRHIGRHDSDARGKINLARLTGKDAVSVNLAASMCKRVARLNEEIENTRIKKRYDLDFRLAGERSPRDCVARLPRQSLPMGPQRFLEVPEMAILPADRIGIVGPNGSGKSTFLRLLVASIDFPPDRVLYIPQEISVKRSGEIVREMLALPSEQLGQVMSFVSCLGSIPARLRETEIPSPGEVRKICLALGLLKKPWVIIMDEPTNHLDLPAIELLESALAQIESALILVSHDAVFLSHLVDRRLCFSGNSMSFDS